MTRALCVWKRVVRLRLERFIRIELWKLLNAKIRFYSVGNVETRPRDFKQRVMWLE